MSDAIRAAIDEMYRAMNTGDVSNLDSVVATDLIDHEEMPGITSTGGQRFKDFIAMFRSAIPDLKVTAEDTIIEDERAAVRFTLSGTQSGSLMGMPPTGKSFSIQGVDIMHFNNGKCIEHWGVSDQVGLLMQLGMMPGGQ